LSIALAAQAAKDVVSAVHGTIQKVDLATKTIVVKTADGAEHSLRFLDRTAVHGVHASAGAGENSWRGLKKGMDIVAHYTRRGTEDTAIEVDNVGTDEQRGRSVERSSRLRCYSRRPSFSRRDRDP
jgi:hypothetical protein